MHESSVIGGNKELLLLSHLFSSCILQNVYELKAVTRSGVKREFAVPRFQIWVGE